MKKNSLITIIVILAVLIFAYFLINLPPKDVDESTAKCIGENSEIYVSLGCHACEVQEEMFGEDYKYLNSIDCFFERELCLEKQIEKTPTWIINGKKYIGTHSIEQLKQLTGCE